MPLTNTHQNPDFQQALLGQISKNIFDFLAVLNKADRKIVFVNEKGANMFGYNKPADMLDTYAPSLRKLVPEQTELDEMLVEITLNGFYTKETEFIDKNGVSFWGQLHLHAFTSDAKEYLLMQIEKIDRVKHAEDRLKKEENRFGALVNYASIGVVIVNQKQEIALLNPFALRLFGYTMEELEGKRLDTLIPRRFHQKHEVHHKNYHEKPQSRPMGIGMDLFAVKKDGTEFPVEVSLGTFDTGNETFAIAFVSDITVRKKGEEQIIQLTVELEAKVRERTDALALTISKLEQQIKETEEVEAELRKSLEKEKELNELKSRFVSMASHEFRTPLSTVLSSIYLLQKYTSTEDQPKRERHIERIASSVNMLTEILNDFLSVGKIEEGKVGIKYSHFNIREFISAIVNDIHTIAKKGQKLTYHHTGEEKVWLDASLVKHIVLNLESNAIKFSPEESEILIKTSQENLALQMSIKDKGLGISKEDQQHLFERFFRGGNVTAIQGTGLGLHIVQKYAELMNGKVTCKSEPGNGTEFIVSFDLKNQ